MVKIYHNPRCSKSRRCLELLQENFAAVEIVEYLKQPPSLKCLESFIAQLGLKAILRTNEEIYKELNLAAAEKKIILQAIANHPQLLQRPIVMAEGKILLARPPEKILELIHA